MLKFADVARDSETVQVIHSDVQNRYPNEWKDGKLILRKCYVCEPERGKTNYEPNISTGKCIWCGYPEVRAKVEPKLKKK